MKLSTQSYAEIAFALRKAAGKYPVEGGRAVVTDIHLQPKADNGELVIFNDDDEVLSRVFIPEWAEYKEGDFDKAVERILREEVCRFNEKGELDNLCIVKPYSFVLVDDDKETLAELLLVDNEDTLLLSEELLKGLDEELDAFLKDLLKD